ncbi:hypothetical protein SAMN04487861_12213 [Selenomonas ruminantium]|uniref:Uncharacterized protein n=1 Tax=Selenomonas ruminantium TaxID=971 RepID=A0A1I3GF89_SELRU|nr:hypothetical protein [Selenomonas ruminantium]SFI22146.1 hypothetical protein SAMN04487861_12213 [Selenomonas ruminantium]
MIWNFVIGGVAGWVLANLLEEDKPAEKVEVTSEQALEVLIQDIREEAECAMDACTTDEECELVYAQVKESVQKLQLTLQEKGEEIIADLRTQTADVPSKEEVADSVDSRVQGFKEKMENLSEALDQALSDLNPKAAKA